MTIIDRSAQISQDQELVESAVKVLQNHLEQAKADLNTLELMKTQALNDPVSYIENHILNQSSSTHKQSQEKKQMVNESKAIRERRDFAAQNYGIHEIDWKSIHVKGVKIPEQVYTNNNLSGGKSIELINEPNVSYSQSEQQKQMLRFKLQSVSPEEQNASELNQDSGLNSINEEEQENLQQLEQQEQEKQQEKKEDVMIIDD